MQYSYFKVNINPEKPYVAYGFITQKNAYQETKGDLYARVLKLSDVIIVSMDTIGISNDSKNELQAKIQELYTNKIALIMACTHSHYAPRTCGSSYKLNAEIDYLEFVFDKIIKELKRTIVRNDDLKISYEHKMFDKVVNDTNIIFNLILPSIRSI